MPAVPPPPPPASSVAVGPRAAVDVGSNSVRLLVLDADGGRITREMRVTRLGAGVDRTGHLDDAALARTLETLAAFRARWSTYGVRDRVRIAATSAVRDAADRERFFAGVRQVTGVEAEVLSGTEEAALAFAGATGAVAPDGPAAVLDIGGGSTELIWIDLSGTPPHLRPRLLMALAPARRGVLEADARARAAAAHIVDWVSAPLGVATLHDRFADIEPTRARFEAMTACFEEQLARFIPYARRAEEGRGRFQIIGASGTVTTIAGAHLGLRRYDRSRVDGSWLPYAGAARVIDELISLDDAARMRHPHIGPDRSLLIVAGAAILDTVMRLWPAERLRVADRGLREGLLYALIGEGAGKT